jgi:SAM-dependent methyltransferase
VNKRFDVVLSLFHVISYQTTNKDVTTAFETAREHLITGGVFIFDVWYGPAVLTEQPEVRIKRMADEKIEVTRLQNQFFIPMKIWWMLNYHVFIRDRESGHVKELKETHVMRYFFKLEIELIAYQADFEILLAEEWMTGEQISEKTWGACFIMRLKSK